MPLAEVQDCLVRLARGDLHPITQDAQLTQAEQHWLQTLRTAPGLKVTTQIQSWWRLNRLTVAAPLTVALLKRKNQQSLIINYITNEPVRTLFFAAEAEQFQNFLCALQDVDVFTKTTIAFECALKNASQMSVGSFTKNSQRFTNLVENCKQMQQLIVMTALAFNRNPLEVFQALLLDRPLPNHEGEPFYVIVSPQLPNLWRSVSAAEYVQLTNAGDVNAQ